MPFRERKVEAEAAPRAVEPTKSGRDGFPVFAPVALAGTQHHARSVGRASTS